MSRTTKFNNDFLDSHIFIVSPPKTATKKTAKSTKPTIRVDWAHSKHGWTVGDVHYKGKKYKFEMKNFMEGSVYGIDKGCISKLFVSDPGKAGVNNIVYGPVIMNYDRGWDIRPQTADAKAILKALKDRFNNGMNAKDLANYKKYVW